MTIREMLASASSEIHSMETDMDALKRRLESCQQDNERLRKLHAEAEARCIHAITDLTHFRNVFSASVCEESMKICREMFELTHANVRKRAEESIQRMIEEKVEKEREESAAKPSSDIINEEEAFQELAPTAEQVRTSIAAASKDDTVIQAPEGMSPKEMKSFYKAYLNYFPPNYAQRPIFYMSEGKWYEKGSFSGKAVPSFLSNREPKEDVRGGISKLVLATFGG